MPIKPIYVYIEQTPIFGATGKLFSQTWRAFVSDLPPVTALAGRDDIELFSTATPVTAMETRNKAFDVCWNRLFQERLYRAKLEARQVS